jgi:hypothetical protein
MSNSEVGVMGRLKIRAYLVPDGATTRTARSGRMWMGLGGPDKMQRRMRCLRYG